MENTDIKNKKIELLKKAREALALKRAAKKQEQQTDKKTLDLQLPDSNEPITEEIKELIKKPAKQPKKRIIKRIIEVESDPSTDEEVIEEIVKVPNSRKLINKTNNQLLKNKLQKEKESRVMAELFGM